MNKEEFVKKCNALREQKLQLEKEYIETNTKYQEGTKLKVTSGGKARIGIVKYNVVEYDKVVPYVNMIRADGEECTRRIRIYPNDEVEVVE
jgi:hypothetical protein